MNTAFLKQKLLLLCFLFLASITQAKEEITIGLIDTFDPDFYLETFVPTVEHLQKELPNYKLKIIEISPKNIIEETEKLKPQFLIASAGDFSTLMSLKGAQQIATVKRPQAINAEKAVFATFVVKNDRKDLQTLRDLENKTAAAATETDFEGWLVPLGEIADAGFNPEKFFKNVKFTGHQFPDVLTHLKVGNVDVGIFGPCQLERLAENGEINKSDFRVIGLKDPKELCARSTKMYPDVVFCSMDGAPSQAVKAITLSLLSFPPQQNNFEWIPASSFYQVFELLKSLKLGPYRHLRETTVKDFLAAHKLEIGLFFALVIAVLIHIVRVNMLVRLRTQELKASIAEQHLIESRALENRERLEMLEKSRVISQLSSMFAHEVKQPITNILYYTSGLKVLLEKLKIKDNQVEMVLDQLREQALRTADIVDHVRSYAKHRPSKEVEFDLIPTVLRALKSIKEQERKGVEVRTVFPSESISAKGDPFEIELVVLNLLKNALSAVKDVSSPEVTITITENEDKIRVHIADNGPALSDEQFEKLGKPIQSKKSDGLGIGLSIALSIIESHGGHLTFSRNQPNGLIVSFSVEYAANKENHNG